MRLNCEVEPTALPKAGETVGWLRRVDQSVSRFDRPMVREHAQEERGFVPGPPLSPPIDFGHGVTERSLCLGDRRLLVNRRQGRGRGEGSWWCRQLLVGGSWLTVI